MKSVAGASLLTVVLLLHARADLTLVQNVDGAGAASVVTIKIKGDKMRIDASPEISTIVDGKSGELLNVIRSQKKFMRISASQAKAAAEMALSADEQPTSQARPQLKPTGKKETINGYEAEEYICDAPAFKSAYWISTKYPDSAAIVKQLQAMTPHAWDVAGKGMPDYRDFPGLPLRSHVTFSGKEIVSTLVSVKQDAVPDSEFVVPAGFEELKMPELDSILGGKPKARPSPKS